MSADQEARRQQQMLCALWFDAPPEVLAGWMCDGPSFTRGLQAYRANAGALAERALAAAYPTLQQLVGDGSFAALARHFWQQSPPDRGDLGGWGADLADFVAAAPDLATEPYLADVARLEWAVHRAASAADDDGPPEGLEFLGQGELGALCLLPRPGTALVRSDHPVLTIWQAHRPSAERGPERFRAVREAFAQGRGESALVWRSGWQVQVAGLAHGDACFTQQVLHGQTLGVAWQSLSGPEGFDFEAWLLAQLHRGWIGAARRDPARPAEPGPAAAGSCRMTVGSSQTSRSPIPPERGGHLP